MCLPLLEATEHLVPRAWVMAMNSTGARYSPGSPLQVAPLHWALSSGIPCSCRWGSWPVCVCACVGATLSRKQAAACPQRLLSVTQLLLCSPFIHLVGNVGEKFISKEREANQRLIELRRRKRKMHTDGGPFTNTSQPVWPSQGLARGKPRCAGSRCHWVMATKVERASGRLLN